MTESDVMAPGPAALPDPARNGERPWPTVAVLLLLVGQIAGFIALFVWRMIALQRQIAEMASGAAEPQVPGGLVVSIGLVVLAVAGFIAGVSILRRARSAWVNAMFVQAVDLALALVLYFSERPFYAYIMMVYGVFVVVYLLIPGVQAAFLPPGGSDDQ